MTNVRLSGMLRIGLTAVRIVVGLATFTFAQARGGADASAANTSSLSEAARAHYQRGITQLRGNDLAGAIESFTLVIDKHPSFEAAYLSRAQAYRRLESQAKTIEERDLAALGYINDEGRVAKMRNRSFMTQELNEVLTKRMLALAAIYCTCWSVVFYLWWYQERSLQWAAVLFLLAHGVAWFVPSTPARLSIGPGALLFLIVAVALGKRKPEPTERPFEDHPLEVQQREMQLKVSTANPAMFETNSKSCPDCGREVSEITRICPRCNHRF